MKPKILVILGSIRQNRFGEKVAKWFMKTVKENQNVDLELIDLREYPLPLFDDAELPSRREGKHSNPQVQKWIEKVASADGYVIITPEYNHSISSALKNALDYPSKEWHNKPVGFISYGGSAGGARAVEHLRGIVGELQMYDVREQVVLVHPWAAFDDNGNLANGEAHAKNAILILEKVAGLAQKLKA